jgi:ketosteroid isomerase-like protein
MGKERTGNMMTADDCVRAAFQALLRGDTAERDRLCALAEDLMRRRDRLNAGGPLIEGDT